MYFDSHCGMSVYVKAKEASIQILVHVIRCDMMQAWLVVPRLYLAMAVVLLLLLLTPHLVCRSFGWLRQLPVIWTSHIPG